MKDPATNQLSTGYWKTSSASNKPYIPQNRDEWRMTWLDNKTQNRTNKRIQRASSKQRAVQQEAKQLPTT